MNEEEIEKHKKETIKIKELREKLRNKDLLFETVDKKELSGRGIKIDLSKRNDE